MNKELNKGLAVQLFLKYSQTSIPLPWAEQPMDEKLKWIKDADKIVENLRAGDYLK